MTDVQQTAIDLLLTDYQTQNDDYNTVDAALPAEPDNDEAWTDKVDFLNNLRRLRTAIRSVERSLGRLRQERMLHADPYNTAAWLQTQRTNFQAQDTTYTVRINDLWLRLLGPTGTPPPSPGGNAADAGAMAMAPAPTTSWVGGFPLGGGGQSIPGVYLRQNRNGRIIDRVCVKDTEWPLPLASSLWDPDFRPNDPNYDAKQPCEIGALTRLNGSSSIIRLRNWHRVTRNNQIEAYRMYQEWCSFGDLYDLAKKYTPYRDILGVPRPATQAEEDWLPEAFLWCCLENLAIAGQLMESGSQNLVGPQPWAQIM